MALQMDYDFNGITVSDAYFRVVVTEISSYKKSFRVDVYANATIAKQSGTTCAQRLGILCRSEVPSGMWETYKLDSVGLEEAGRSIRKGIYEYLVAEYSQERDEEDQPILYFADATSI